MPSKSKSRQRKVKSSFATLIERTAWIVAIAREFCTFVTTQGTTALAGVALELKAYLSSMQTIVHNARRAQVAGETVPASERVFSLFEQHTELIKRGKRQKPVEFGHKVLLCESKEKFITDYEVYEKQLPDCELTEEVIQRHKKLFARGRRLWRRTRASVRKRRSSRNWPSKWRRWRSPRGCRTSSTRCLPTGMPFGRGSRGRSPA